MTIKAAGLGLILLAMLPAGLGCRSTPAPTAATEPKLLKLAGDLRVHDPAIIKADQTYYIFCTGGGGGRGIMPIHCSTNLLDWRRGGSVFEQLPAWATNEIPLARGAWAPDISWFDGKYHLYYALSSFGVNKSAIGLAINETLDPASPRYQWVDEGLVIRSLPQVDDFNAIDPVLIVEDKRHVWLAWGSFWGGIKMRRIDPATGKLSAEDTNLYSLASRPRLQAPQTPPVEGAIEAPTIIKRGKYWYLFASYDFCCRGTNSTYNVKVGRAKKVTGPYADRDGRLLMEDGGTPVIPAVAPGWIGAGHQAVFEDGGLFYIIFHSYDRESGQSRLQISTLVWDNGWPRAATEP